MLSETISSRAKKKSESSFRLSKFVVASLCRGVWWIEQSLVRQSTDSSRGELDAES